MVKTEIKTEKYPKLPKVFKKKWIEALRSGEYEQGIDGLKLPLTDNYCCLGVACKIAGIPDKELESGGIPNDLVKTRRLPKMLTHKIDSSPEGETLAKLTKMNDKERLHFEDIANWIEENL